MMAQGQSKKELLEVLVLRMRLLKELVRCGALEAVQKLGLIRQVFEGLSIVFVTSFR